jgi:hypothetical protein
VMPRLAAVKTFFQVSQRFFRCLRRRVWGENAVSTHFF